MKKKRRLNWQKIFSFVSLIFILVCVFWYGGRLLYFYQDSKKVISEEASTLAGVIKSNNYNQEDFKLINKSYYFYGDTADNYVSYSNLVWRIVKVNEDGSMVLVSENILSSLPFGEESTYEESGVIQWLNQSDENDTLGLEDKLNQKDIYLTTSQVCVDKVGNVQNVSCDDVYDKLKLGLLSIQDYLNTGGTESFINNNRSTYLANKNEDDEIWYITEEGKLDVISGEEFLGIKPVITLSANVVLKGGAGSSDDPYRFEETTGVFASYVKLGNDLWRVYENTDTVLKLVLQDKISEQEEVLESTYSKNNYYHNDTVSSSLAYYLNKNYLNSLAYKDVIIENSYVNGYYGSDNDFNYQDIIENVIDTKVTVPSIGDVILNDELGNYFTNTGLSKESSLIYVMKGKGIVSTKSVSAEANVIPCISIMKDKIIAGTGTSVDPYRLEA